MTARGPGRIFLKHVNPLQILLFTLLLDISIDFLVLWKLNQITQKSELNKFENFQIQNHTNSIPITRVWFVDLPPIGSCGWQVNQRTRSFLFIYLCILWCWLVIYYLNWLDNFNTLPTADKHASRLNNLLRIFSFIR